MIFITLGRNSKNLSIARAFAYPNSSFIPSVNLPQHWLRASAFIQDTRYSSSSQSPSHLSQLTPLLWNSLKTLQYNKFLFSWTTCHHHHAFLSFYSLRIWFSLHRVLCYPSTYLWIGVSDTYFFHVHLSQRRNLIACDISEFQASSHWPKESSSQVSPLLLPTTRRRDGVHGPP